MPHSDWARGPFHPANARRTRRRHRTSDGKPDVGPVVVVGFDGSPAGERALDRAATRIARTRGQLIVVHAIDSEISAGGLTQPVLEEPSAGQRRSILERARRLVGSHHLDAKVLERVGQPTEVLVDVALEHSAELLVVGARGRNYVARALRGSTAENVVRDTPCDVLVVR
jgi:nucleotide-binding universal stress UspA family protein